MKTHVIATNDDTSDLGNTITTYKCTAWCAAIEAIPDMVHIKVLPYHLIDLAQMSPDSKCKCPLLSIFIYVNVFWMNYFLFKTAM
jgi:hypothetical protein